MLMSGAMDICGLVHYDLEKIPESKIYPTYQDIWDLDYCAGNPSYIVRICENRAMNFFGDYVVSTETNKYGGATSSDEGRTWTNFTSMPIIADRPTSVAMSATDPNVIIMLSRSSAFRTQDGGKSWQRIELPFSRGKKSLESNRVNGLVFYYFNDGTFYRSTDAGKNFFPTEASFPTVDHNRIVSNVVAVSGMEEEVWVSLDTDGLYRSSDSGSSFFKVKNVEKVLLFDFGRPLEGMTNPVLYLYGNVKGENGVFRSLDFGKKWQSITPENEVGIGCAPMVMEASEQHAGLVFIGTGGRGIFYGIPVNNH
jgi:photosystem II stability/assembly factor-like uncharacterized protein